MHKVLKPVLKIILTLVLPACLVLNLSACMTMQIGERNFIHPDSKSGYKQQEQFDQAALQRVASNATLQEHRIATTDSQTLRGVSMLQAGAGATVLYFGGNMFHLDRHAGHIAAALGQCKLNLFMFDYRGYGRSTGEPGVANMQSDALQIYDYVRQHSQGKLIVHGQSLGSFMAAYVAQQRQPDGLVMESTANNAYDWASANMPWYARPFVSIELSPVLKNIDNAAALSAYTGNSLLVMGDKDKVTPLELGQKVYAAIPQGNKRLFVSAGGEHDGLLDRGDVQATYCSFVQAFK
ncbi:alpha/beta hydrolase [Undibacterium sp. JH2W]|uniref:alpha/beta hydrolase n=1 Tax=Undibacterium sp. JH2W TaxID=3413037 RepID=UPI003BF05835